MKAKYKKLLSDPIVLIISLLLISTMLAYLAGIFIYPYGLLILIALLAARISHLWIRQ